MKAMTLKTLIATATAAAHFACHALIRRRFGLSVAIGLALASTTGLSIDAAEIRKLALPDGTEITYALALPANFAHEQVYPALVVFPGGQQTIASVEGALERFWEAEGLRRGFIVISPSAPQAKPFFKDGVTLVPEFLSHFLKTYRIKGDKFHLAGNSNGGVSAFRAAVRYPQLFASLTVIAGFPDEEDDFGLLDRLKNIGISMFVGDGDIYWKEGMQRTVERLNAIGNEAYFEILPRNGHFLPDLSFEKSTRIFDHIRQ